MTEESLPYLRGLCESRDGNPPVRFDSSLPNRTAVRWKIFLKSAQISWFLYFLRHIGSRQENTADWNRFIRQSHGRLAGLSLPKKQNYYQPIAQPFSAHNPPKEGFFIHMPARNFWKVLQRKIGKSHQRFADFWWPVGESNPCYSRERAVS